MTKLLFAICFLSSTLWATGQLKLEGDYFTKSNNAFPRFGLQVYEPLGNFFVDSWVGGAWVPTTDGGKFWSNGYVDAGFLINPKLSVAAGVRAAIATADPIEYPNNHDIHVTLAYKLW